MDRTVSSSGPKKALRREGKQQEVKIYKHPDEKRLFSAWTHQTMDSCSQSNEKKVLPRKRKAPHAAYESPAKLLERMLMGNNARRWQLCAHHVAIATRDDPAAMITFNATLSNAVVTNNVGVLKELLKAGASVNSCDSAFNTLLHLACRSGHEEVIQFLVKHGAVCNTCTKDGSSPLHDLCKRPDFSPRMTLLVLRSQWPMLLGMDKHGRTCLDFVSESTRGEWCRFLHDFMPMFMLMCPEVEFDYLGSSRPSTALAAAAYHGDTDPCEYMARLMVADGAKSECWSVLPKYWNTGIQLLQSDLDGYTAELLKAVNTNDVCALQVVLESGVSPNAHNAFGHCVLHLAARLGHAETVAFLIASGACVTVTDESGKTPMHDACWGQDFNVDIIRMLLAHQTADLLHAQDRLGASPLKYVSQTNWGIALKF
eukprot:g2554.t1